MSSRDTTPEVSPIRSALRCRDSYEEDVEMAEVKEDELEDGEISDETGQDNLSTIRLFLILSSYYSYWKKICFVIAGATESIKRWHLAP